MLFFCEYHEHIRKIQLRIELPSAPDHLTSLDIFDRKTLRLRHAFQSYTIALPASLTTGKLDPVFEASTITLRASADAIVKRSNTNDVPLSTDVSLKQPLCCIKCGSVLIQGSRMSWRNLPSENWAEMMDSWHCHRGVTDHQHHETHDQYALPDHIISAAERIRARLGTGYIGKSYLLVDHHNMENIMCKNECAYCSTCHSEVGEGDGTELKVGKKYLDPHCDDVNETTYTIAEILASVEESSVHRFLLTNTSDETVSTLIWVVTPDARITASDICNKSPGLRVMKIMYSLNRGDTLGEEVEELRLAESEYMAVVKALYKGNSLMGGQVIQGWLAAFLPRFEPQ